MANKDKITAWDVLMSLPSDATKMVSGWQCIAGQESVQGTFPVSQNIEIPIHEVIQGILDHIGLEIRVEEEKKLPQKTVFEKTKKPKANTPRD